MDQLKVWFWRPGTHPYPLSPQYRRVIRSLGLVVMGVLLNFSFSPLVAIAQEAEPTRQPEPEPTPEVTNELPSEPLPDAAIPADDTEHLAPRLRPAASTGDLVGDFFSVSVSACSLDPELLVVEEPEELLARGFASAQTISQTEEADPSLWWPRTRFGQDELVQNWLIDFETQNINLVIDRAAWSAMNYIEHFRVVHQFGAIAREKGYQLRIFNNQPKCLAIYDCETIATGQMCKVDMEPSRRDPFNFF